MLDRGQIATAWPAAPSALRPVRPGAGNDEPPDDPLPLLAASLARNAILATPDLPTAGPGSHLKRLVVAGQASDAADDAKRTGLGDSPHGLDDLETEKCLRLRRRAAVHCSAYG